MNEGNPLGRWLRQRRKALDLTQADLAQLVGCAPVTIQKIEGGDRRPSKQMAQLLADCLRLEPGRARAVSATGPRRDAGMPEAESGCRVNSLPSPLTP